MKFSYTLLKKLVPAIKSKKDLLEKLNLYIFEAEDAGGDTIEISISPNRFSSAGHWGLAREIAAVYGGKFEYPIFPKVTFRNIPKVTFQIYVKTDLCRRIMGQYFEYIKIKPSPRWMQKILADCGLRSINNLVDITNYVMLETGQPLHAFDFDKLDVGELIVRQAELGESIHTLDGQKFNLDSNMVVIADNRDPLDIAGIKGGKKSGINDQTSKIILTAANFDGSNIYKTSKKLNLATDASSRNSHNLSPVLVSWAITRASQFIEDLCDGQRGKQIDIYNQKTPKKVLRFSIEKFNQLIGLALKEREAIDYLRKLGFVIGTKNSKGVNIEVLPERDDIQTFEDLTEEVARLYGYNHLPAFPPHIHLMSSGFEEKIIFKDKIRKILINFGLSEVYNYSFVSKNDLEKSAGEFLGIKNEKVANPISSEFEYLRSSLAAGLLKNIDDNFRFFNEVRVFEIGHVFAPEKTILGLALGSKMTSHIKNNPILELKGFVDELLAGMGLVDHQYTDLNFDLDFLNKRESLRVESDHHVIGYIGSARGVEGKQAIAEIDLEKVIQLAREEKEYEPLSKYPSIMRDISLLMPRQIRVNQIMEIVEKAAPHYLDDVDLIDFYENDDLGENFKSLTFRLVFLAEDRTLTDKEVDRELQKVTSALINQLGIEIR